MKEVRKGGKVDKSSVFSVNAVPAKNGMEENRVSAL